MKKIPNIITLTRLFFLPLLVYFMWYSDHNYNWYAVFILIFISFGDLLDGFLARKLNAVTATGKIIDPMADKLVILVSVTMLLYLRNIHPVVAILILSREIVVLTVRAIASNEGIVLSANTIAKRKTFIQIVGLCFITANIKLFGFTTVDIGAIILIISIFLSWISLFIYFNDLYKFKNLSK